MFEVLNYEDSKSAISKAIEEIEVEGNEVINIE